MPTDSNEWIACKGAARVKHLEQARAERVLPTTIGEVF